MIHTFKLSLSLESRHINYLQSTHGVDIFEMGRTIGSSFEGIFITVVRAPFNSLLFASVFVDVTKVLNRGTITEMDLPIIEGILRRTIETVFGDRDLYDQHKLMRIDYRFDVRITDQQRRLDYVKLFSKSLRKKGKRLKKLGFLNVHGHFEAYGTGLEHSNQSIETTIYDKNAERENKGEPIVEYEKDVLRFEIRLKKGHLYYQTRMTGLLRVLSNYFSQACYYYYIENYLLDTYLPEDFYKFSIGIGLVEASDMTPRCKNSLKTFLVKVSRGDMSSPQKSMAASTYNRRLAECKALGIHPVAIPSGWKHAPDVMENPMADLKEEANNYKKPGVREGTLSAGCTV